MKNINEINIKSFRGIRNLRLTDLAQVNIIAGNNNCGKTSVLEIIESLRQPDDILMWSSLSRRTTTSMRNRMSFYEGIYDLFDINIEDKRLEYTFKTEDDIVTLGADAVESVEEITEKRYEAISGLSYIEKENREELEDQTREIARIEFKVALNGKAILKEKIYEGQMNASVYPRPLRRQKSLTQNIVYISPTRHASGEVFLGEVLNRPDLYEEMLSILKEFDENILSINYDKNNFGRGTYKILSKSNNKALPLNVYGDGMKKAILLMSAVVKANDGILLLDEFETAIHTSAMERTFKWILETCKKLNVQVFMTSHSIEAISKVLKCCPDMEKDIRMITLVETLNGIKARNVDAAKAIKLKEQYGLELR